MAKSLIDNAIKLRKTIWFKDVITQTDDIPLSQIDQYYQWEYIYNLIHDVIHDDHRADLQYKIKKNVEETFDEQKNKHK